MSTYDFVYYTRRCVVAYLLLPRLYQTLWYCLFGTSVTVPEDVVLHIWYFWNCTRKCGFACLALLGLYQNMLCCLFGTSITLNNMSCCLFGTSDTLQKIWSCLFGTSGTVPEYVVLPNWYYWDCTRRCGFPYLVLRRM